MKKTNKVKVISHDKNGRKIYEDSILRDTLANEYFIPTKSRGEYGDIMMGDFYPLEPKNQERIKIHATMDDLKKLMQESTDKSAVFNVKGDFNEN